MKKQHRFIDELYPIAEAQLGYFTASQASEIGLNTANLAQLANRGVLERVSRGVYRLSRYPNSARDSLMEAMLWPQAKSGGPIGVISHESALAFYGMSEVSPSRIHITVPMDARLRRELPRHLTIHRATLQPAEVKKVDGILVTTPERSLRDAAAAHLGRSLLRQAIEDGARSGHLIPSQAQRLADEMLSGEGVAAAP
ncbi:type IV toxin-antitoxin system AbiEi family antitoxin domain-containing protein [Gemmatimonas sp.]|uniref:type IV toxin-antitoxin system AbiEi family antitoxin domain-containing protein n=1 Tax=Gemmatimonas sp. TaxID=1962908 RepID=UPI0037C05F0A